MSIGLAGVGLFLVLGATVATMIGAPGAGRAGGPVVLAAQPLVLERGTTPRPAAEQRASVPADPVGAYVDSGRPLPAYISNGNTPATAAAPAGTTPAAPAAQPTQTAAVQPSQPVPPIPAPLSQRPPSVTTASVPSESIVIPDSVRQPSATPPGLISSQPAPVPPAAVSQPRPVASAHSGRVIHPDELDGWEYGPLNDFLAQRGQGGPVPYEEEYYYEDDYYAYDYDPDGFYLDEGPNRSSANWRRYGPQEPPVVNVWPLYD